jgi:hypothetical protein
MSGTNPNLEKMATLFVHISGAGEQVEARV